jgi:type III secretory pathway component EscT
MVVLSNRSEFNSIVVPITQAIAVAASIGIGVMIAYLLWDVALKLIRKFAKKIV